MKENMGFLEKIFGKIRGKPVKPRRIYVILGDDKKEYILIDGKYVPRDKIIHVDPLNNKIVYIDVDGKLKVSAIEQKEQIQINKKEEKTVFT